MQTRWGVGFGPRDCSDYQTGISVIPISRLTEADRKWALTAEYGGTGGRALEGGMVIEEPDIEIGAGVSSKGMPVFSRTGELPLTKSQPSADVCQPMPLAVGVGAMVLVETTMLDVATLTDVRT